jgi:catechol 2,3-dioxygenase-like lactoylglutathione lyase family enzyme
MLGVMRAPGASAAPFVLKGIEHVLFLVEGLERSIAFYQDVIGAQLETEGTQLSLYVRDPSGNLIELMGEFT